MFWYEEDVKKVEEIKKKVLNPRTIVYGSSSIRLWSSLSEDLEGYSPINMGFGGSTLPACITYFDRLMDGLNPEIFILYAGDNDLGDGRHPEEVLIFFKQMVVDIRNKFGEIPLLYLSIKPSIKRFNIIDQIKYSNKIIAAAIQKMDSQVYFVDVYGKMMGDNNYPNRDYFNTDGLHMNQQGYQIWKEIVVKFMKDHNIALPQKK